MINQHLEDEEEEAEMQEVVEQEDVEILLHKHFS